MSSTGQGNCRSTSFDRLAPSSEEKYQQIAAKTGFLIYDEEHMRNDQKSCDVIELHHTSKQQGMLYLYSSATPKYRPNEDSVLLEGVSRHYEGHRLTYPMADALERGLVREVEHINHRGKFDEELHRFQNKQMPNLVNRSDFPIAEEKYTEEVETKAAFICETILDCLNGSDHYQNETDYRVLAYVESTLIANACADYMNGTASNAQNETEFLPQAYIESSAFYSNLGSNTKKIPLRISVKMILTLPLYLLLKCYMKPLISKEVLIVVSFLDRVLILRHSPR